MKKSKKIISMLLVTSFLLLSFFSVASAKTVIMNENFNSCAIAENSIPWIYSADGTLKGVVGAIRANNSNAGNVGIGVIPGTDDDRAIVSKLWDDSYYNRITVLSHNSLCSSFKDFWSVSFRICVEDGEDWALSLFCGNNNNDYSKESVLVKGSGIDNRITCYGYADGVLTSRYNSFFWKKDTFVDVKMIFDMKNETCDMYLDGKLRVKDASLKDLDWSTEGAYALTFWMKGNQKRTSSKTEPSISYIDDVVSYSYDGENEMEIYPEPDCFSNDSSYTGVDRDMTYVGNIDNAFGKTCLGFDFINRSGAVKPLCVAAAFYEKDAEGYSQLKSVKLKNVSLAAGITRVLTPIFDLTKSGDAESYVKVFTWDTFDQLLPYDGFLQLTAQ